MSFLTDPERYLYRSTDIFLGLDKAGEIGVDLERHAITVAGSRSGKGAALIIPNLLRWRHSAIVIDPKGENAAKTWEERERTHSAVYVLDPFKSADVPDRIRASFNPLINIDPDGLTAREDVEVIADGLVKRADPKHAQWDDGAAAILAGIIAFVVSDAPDDSRTLREVRNVLLQSRDELYADAQRMRECTGCGGLAVAAGISIMTAIEADKGMEQEFLEGARRHSKWIDSPAVSSVLNHSSFDLADLKNSKATVYVVLPPQYLDTHASFMRLLVRCAINVMAAGGSGKGEKCLFILDEFFALGRIDEISKSCGLMPSYGVHLWPFLQDLGQLKTLYQGALWETFFSNADAAIFFGNTDQTTTEYVSKRIGNISPQELNIEPPTAPLQINSGSGPNEKNAVEQTAYSDAMTDYNKRTKEIGRPRIPPEKIASVVGKEDGEVVASSMLVFAKSGDILHLRLAPYFKKNEYTSVPKTSEEQARLKGSDYVEKYEKSLEISRKRADKYNWLAVVLWLVGFPAAIILFGYLVVG